VFLTIKDAKANAVRNEITNCEFFVGDMKVVFNDAFIAQHGHPDVTHQRWNAQRCD
jgi:23S rRNA (uracil1939-C5)-methyltransferase